MYEGHTVAVVIPAYNEEGFVGEVIDTVPGYVDRIYAIDDCSTDDTWDEIRRHARRRNEARVAVDDDARQASAAKPDPVEDTVSTADGRDDPEALEPDDDAVAEDPDEAVADGGLDARTVMPIQNERNRGVGGTITVGYQHALEDGIDVTAVMAGDGQMDPDYLDRLLDPLVEGRAEYAKGNRLYGRDRSAMSSWRLFGNLLLSYLTKISSGYWRMMDPQNGYTAISLEALERIDLEGLYTDYGFSNDLLVALNTQGFRVADVSMPAVYGDERSHIQYRSFVPNLSWLLLRRFVHRLYVRYLLLDFHPLALMYALGVGGGALALAGLGAALDEESSQPVTGVLLALVLLVLSSITLLLAMTFDRLANDDLVVSVQ
ncbi:glycosyltransferase [Natronobeatus ordinarius]|uniref:glycosyltransferase n=1 Tax=Natronobeatus ordinarius TaxID=2963433 RepID=UPI0020CBBB56|nr:glycosyltransferase [Natronobeatus ordinarius]